MNQNDKELAERGDSTHPDFCKSLILKEHSVKYA
jgi:hypothetical protein